MPTALLSTEYIDYLQRSGVVPRSLTQDIQRSLIPQTLRRLWRIEGIGRLEKEHPPVSRVTNYLANASTDNSVISAANVSHWFVTTDALIGLYGYRIPVAFQVWGEPNGVALHWGTWLSNHPGDAKDKLLDARQAVLQSVLSSLFPVIELTQAPVELSPPPLAGFVLGVPTAKASDELDGALPLDRLIRALGGTNWACLVLADPVDEQHIALLRHNIINEMRSVETAVEEAHAPSPLARHYMQLLEMKLATLTQGQAIGAWRTAVYLLGDVTSYYRLASVWRGIFSGIESVPEPVRVWDSSDAAKFAVSWAMPDSVGTPGPGMFAHPYEYQTLLSSQQLAAYIHLPQLETVGFRVKAVPEFDSVPLLPKSPSVVQLGAVMERAHITQTNYCIAPKALSRHTLVAGVTGSGKTNTIFYLLKQLQKLAIPFLVVEPTKTEYRALLNDPALAKSLRIFTLGNENISPLRLNPFEVVGWPHTSVGTHLDLLRSLFTASFGMWTPLPQILEQCLHRIYVDLGWDITTNTNDRIDPSSTAIDAFPTLSDLLAKVDEVTVQLGYEQRVTDDMRAALRTRINGLRSGGKGRMLDVQRSIPMELLLSGPTILELEGMGDDDDKAFMIGLLLIRLAEYLRAQGQADDVRHLLVIEEAHRLLANVAPRVSEEASDPRGKAVETFANLLSEIRAYGQGVIVTDQIPVKLTPDVIKNTNLKIVHRIVAQDDRAVLAGAMAMNDQQMQALAALLVGQAAVFTDGDDTPLLIKVPPAKDQFEQTIPSDEQVEQWMKVSHVRQEYTRLLLPFDTCAQTCPKADSVCWQARPIVENAAFQQTMARVLLSTLENAASLDRLWPDVLAVARAFYPPQIVEEKLLHCLLIRYAKWFATHRGRQLGWSYAQTRKFADCLSLLLLRKLNNLDTHEARQQLYDLAIVLHHRTSDPFPACSQICKQPICLYRYTVSDMIDSRHFTDSWNAADRSDATSKEARRVETWAVCQDAGYELIEWPEDEFPEHTRQACTEAAQSVCLCFAQQMLAHDPRKSPRTVRKVMDKIIGEAYK